MNRNQTRTAKREPKAAIDVGDIDYDNIIEGLAEVRAHVAGEVTKVKIRTARPVGVAAVDVKAIRKARGLTQAEFAATYGLAVGTVRDWEQDRYKPDPVASILLAVIDRHPEAVVDVLIPQSA